MCGYLILRTTSFSSALSIFASDPPLFSHAVFDASHVLTVDSFQKQTLRAKTEKEMHVVNHVLIRFYTIKYPTCTRANLYL